MASGCAVGSVGTSLALLSFTKAQEWPCTTVCAPHRLGECWGYSQVGEPGPSQSGQTRTPSRWSTVHGWPQGGCCSCAHGRSRTPLTTRLGCQHPQKPGGGGGRGHQNAEAWCVWRAQLLDLPPRIKTARRKQLAKHRILGWGRGQAWGEVSNWSGVWVFSCLQRLWVIARVAPTEVFPII